MYAGWNPKTSDIYEITIRIVKAIIHLIIISLTEIYNNCLTNGVFKKEIKMTCVCPVFKKGHLSNPENYRPITILPGFGTIFNDI